MKLYLKNLLLGHALMLLIIGITVALEYPLGFPRTFLLLFFYSFLIIGFAKSYFKFFQWPASVGVLAFFLSIFAAMGETGKFIGEYRAAQKNIPTISVKDLYYFPPQHFYQFTDGYVDRTRMYSTSYQSTIYSRTGGGPKVVTTNIAVAPLVYEGWDAKKDPVPAWVFCADTDGKAYNPVKDCIKQWQEPYRAGIIGSHLHEADIERTLGAAEQIFGLQSTTLSPVLVWVKDIHQEMAFKLRIYIIIGILSFGWWNLMLLKHYFISPVTYPN